MAVRFLQRNGYRVLARNYRAIRGEIDIIVQDGSTLVFVEVKTGTTDKYGDPETWVNHKKQAQIAKVAQAYLSKHGLEDMDCRFDVIAIKKKDHHEIRHFKDAFWL
ncbi:YraN family protein [bacterium]|nr:YraN family protein [bacterium]